jgi:hypothetical protein
MTPAGRERAAFSLVELMTAIALLTLIVLGLLAMFSQVQRVFRASAAEADYMEAGRNVMDMIARDLEQMTPSRMARTTNFYAEIAPGFDSPLKQRLAGTEFPGDQDLRVNVVQRFYCLTLANQDWNGIGYQVVADRANAGWGTLCRYSTNGSKSTAYYLLGGFLQAPPARLDRIADGVVHLRVRALATNGLPITPAGFQVTPARYLPVRNATSLQEASLPEEVRSYFSSNAVPAYLELELGLMEPRVVERARALGNSQARYEYLSNHVAQVHLFRQRIPIRNVDFAAYQ